MIRRTGPVLLLLAGWLLATPPAQAGAADSLLVGEMRKFTLHPAPKPVAEIAFRDGSDAERSLADFRGKLVLVNLWATWCAPCREEMPALDRLQAELGGAEFHVLALAVDRAGPAKVRKFLDEVGASRLDLYIDTTSKSARALAAPGLPTTILIDAEGREIGRLLGAAHWDAPEAVALMRHFLPPRGGKPLRAEASGGRDG